MEIVLPSVGFIYPGDFKLQGVCNGFEVDFLLRYRVYVMQRNWFYASDIFPHVGLFCLQHNWLYLLTFFSILVCFAYNIIAYIS